MLVTVWRTMRPDEHKKKRSQQYKKKHGIEGQGQGTGKGKKCEKTSGGLNVVKGTKETDEKVKKITSNPDNDGSDQDALDVPSFRRRKIESNWQRYEEENESDIYSPDGASVVKRGESFQTLLNSTSEAIAQFKFDEEKSWCEETDTMTDVLKLDCSLLSSRLKCVPLHERLDLPADLVDEKMLEKFNAEAEECKKKYVDIIEIGPQATSVVSHQRNKTAENTTSVLSLRDSELDDILSGVPPIGNFEKEMQSSQAAGTSEPVVNDNTHHWTVDKNHKYEHTDGAKLMTVNCENVEEPPRLPKEEVNKTKTEKEDDLFDFLSTLDDGDDDDDNSSKMETSKTPKKVEADVNDFLSTLDDGDDNVKLDESKKSKKVDEADITDFLDELLS